MDKFVSVIIPVLNNLEGLCQTLSALENQTYPSGLYEVIVVDNGSQEDLAGAIAQFPQVKLTYEPQAGSYHARNQGISVAQGEILAFTDSDCLPATDWLTQGVAELQAIADCGLVAGKIEFLFRNPHQPTTVELYDSLTYLDQQRYIQQYHYGVTANLFTWKSVIERIGNFNGNLKSGGDKEWGNRVYQQGYTLKYSPKVLIAHPARDSYPELIRKIVRTRTGGHNLDIMSDLDRGALNRQRLFKILWRLKPPLKTIIKKLDACLDSITIPQKVKLISITLWLHYYGLWSDLRFYLGKD